MKTSMDFKQYVDFIIYFMNREIVPVILGLSLVAFLWGVFRYYILHGADTNEREHARLFMLWGLIGMILLFTVWGLVNIAGNVLML